MVRGGRSSEGTQQQNKIQRNDQSRRQVFKSTKEFQKLLSQARRRVCGLHECMQRQGFEMLATEKSLDQVRELESCCWLQKSFIVARGPDGALLFGPSTAPRIERGNAPEGGQEHVRQQKKKENLPQPVRGENTTRVPPTAEGASTDGGRRREERWPSSAATQSPGRNYEPLGPSEFSTVATNMEGGVSHTRVVWPVCGELQGGPKASLLGLSSAL